MLETYNNNILDNMFFYPTFLNTSIAEDTDNNINKCFVSIKKEYYSKVMENTFCNENINILLRVETICRPVFLHGLIDIDSCNLRTETRIEKYLRYKLINKCTSESLLNAYFDKIYCRTKSTFLDYNNVVYDIVEKNDDLLITKSKCDSMLIMNVDCEIDIDQILRSYQNFDKIVFNPDCTGYIFSQKNKNTYYYKFKNINNFVQFDPYPKVSVVMTVYNKEQYVEFAIKSVLNQSYKNLELIIIEDCSTDNSLQIVNKFQGIENVKIICNKQNSGCYVSRNIGITNATGSIIAFQDADDYTLEHRIEKQINLMITKNLLMVGCNMIRSHIPNINYENDMDILNDVEKSIKHFDLDCCNEMFGYPTLLIKKELFDRHGYYIERKKGMDMEFPERVMFKELGKKFTDSSWDFLDKESNKIYEKLNELLVISPDMNETNISNNIKSDDYLKNKLWRDTYV
jgi:hypothetical protein